MEDDDFKLDRIWEDAHIDVMCPRIIIFGRSLGGAVAVDLATRYSINEFILCRRLRAQKHSRGFQPSQYYRSQNKDKIAAVLLENTFTSIPDIARLLFPFRYIQLG